MKNKTKHRVNLTLIQTCLKRYGNRTTYTSKYIILEWIFEIKRISGEIGNQLVVGRKLTK